MRTVQSFQTDDGKLFTKEQEGDAIRHAQYLAIKGVVQDSALFRQPKHTQVTPDDVAKLILFKEEDIKKVNYTYNRKMQGYLSRHTAPV